MKDTLLITENVKTTERIEEYSSLENRISKATLNNYNGILEEINQLGSNVLKDTCLGQLSKVLNVSKSVLQKDMQTKKDERDNVRCASFPELVDIVLDNSGKVSYLIKQEERLVVTDFWKSSDGGSFLPPERKQLPFTLPSGSKVLELYEKGVDQKELFDDLVTYFKRFSYLGDEVWPLIAFSVFLSYLQDHEDVRYIPVIYFHAVAERGKSRTAKSILSVSYRGIHLVDLRSANIFRFSENLNATLFFDCTSLWETAKKSDCSDILLNRFEKGAKAARVLHMDKGAFEDQVYYDIYGSTVVATNEPANTTFESRCLTISMPNMPSEYEDLVPEMGLELKERFLAWRAQVMDKPLPEVKPIPGISGRLWDITKPLFRLCQMINPEVKESMVQVLLEMVHEKQEDKKESFEGRIVAAIDSLADFSEGQEVVIPVEDIRRLVNLERQERYHTSPQRLGKRIKSLSLRTKLVRGYSRLTITQKELNLLKEQYGLLKESAEQVEQKISESCETDLSHAEDHSVEASGIEFPEEANEMPGFFEPAERVVESGRESLDTGTRTGRKPIPWTRHPETQTAARKTIKFK